MQEDDRVSLSKVHVAHLRIEDTSPPPWVQIKGSHASLPHKSWPGDLSAERKVTF
jgi:hypothetical protein